MSATAVANVGQRSRIHAIQYLCLLRACIKCEVRKCEIGQRIKCEIDEFREIAVRKHVKYENAKNDLICVLTFCRPLVFKLSRIGCPVDVVVLS